MKTQISKSNMETPRTQSFAEEKFPIQLCESLRSLRLCVTVALIIAATCTVTFAASTNDITSLVQRGLFEEEANHDLNAAMQSYESAIKLHDTDRKLAATAIFRLGECYRKQDKTDEANKQYQRIVTEFPDQKELVDLSRGYLPKATNTFQAQPTKTVTAAIGSDLEWQYREIAAETVKAEALWKHVYDLSKGHFGGQKQRDDLAKFFTTIQPDQLMINLVHDQSEATAKLDKLGVQYGPQHPEYKAQQEVLNRIAQQISERADALVWSVEQRYKMLKDQEDALKSRLNQTTAPVAKLSEATTTAEEAEEIRKIKEMIQDSPDLINVPVNSDEGTPLQRACIKGHLKVAEFLLDNGADVNLRADKVSPPLICAAVHGHKALIDLLLSKGADIEIQSTSTYYNQTALMCAANRGFKTIVETLLAHGANVNVKDSTGRSAVHRAAESGYAEVVALLLAHKAAVDARSLENKTPLHLACDNIHADVVKVLLEHGADVNAKSAGGFTPLLNATEHDHLDIARLLLEHGANTEDAVSPSYNQVDLRSRRAINFAIRSDDAALLKLLLEHHANPNSTATQQDGASTIHGVTPLLTTLKPDLVEILLDHGADPNLADENGKTPLHLAVEAQQKHCVQLLIAHGANVNAANNGGTPPIAYVRGATKGDSAEIRQMLLKAGADENYARARVITIWRDGRERTVFTRDTNNWNHFTLMELMSVVYGLNESPRVTHDSNMAFFGGRGHGRMSFVHPIPLPGGYVIPSFQYPDFSRITINRLTKNGEKKEIKADVRDMLGRADAQKEIPLEWGDIVEIPEQDHPVNKSWEGLSEPRQRQIMDVLARNVEIRIKGAVTNFDVLPTMPNFQSTASLRRNTPAETRLPDNVVVSEFGLNEFITKTGLLRSSSDVSHIKITRKHGDSTRSITVDLNNGDEPWISAGDVIEIPDRDNATAQSD